jgi:transglutaminase-like putative cysteine protease
MKLHIQHVTRYEYSAPLQYALQSLCLTPQGSAHQTVLDWSVKAPGPLFPSRDGYGNVAHTCSVTRRLTSGSVWASGTVQTHGEPVLVDDAAPAQVYLRPTALTQSHTRLSALGADTVAGGRVDESRAIGLAREVLARVPYKPRTTSVHTTAMEALALGGGVCQDHAHIFIATCRSHGVPARYVSGYFHAPGAEHLASHAWVDVCVDLPRGRWLSVDVTHGCLIDERHVRLAVGPDYAACSPIRGVREGGGTESMRVRIDIRDTSDLPVFSLEP